MDPKRREGRKEVKKNFPYALLSVGIIYALLFVLVLIYGDNKLALFFNPATGSIQNNYGALFLDVFTNSLFYIGLLFLLLTFLSLIIPVWKKFRPALLSISLSFTLTSIFVTGLKLFFNRPRPFDVFGNKINTFGVNLPMDASLPSGHSGNSMALAASIGLNTKKVWWWIIPLFLALLMAFTRLYFGFHFLSDVIVGGIIGLIMAYLSQLLITKLYEKKVMSSILEWIFFLTILLAWIVLYFVA